MITSWAHFPTLPVGKCTEPMITGSVHDLRLFDPTCELPAYRVVERVDGGFLGFDLVCGSNPEVTAGLESGQGLDGYVLCLAPS
jgi:hypothetical protein